MASDDKWNLEGPCRLCADLCNRDIDHIFSDDKTFLVDLIKKYLSIKVGILYTCNVTPALNRNISSL